jgi:carbon-monoxide dehydrogenase medium subunit
MIYYQYKSLRDHMNTFTYHRAATLSLAKDAFKGHENVKFLSGGMTLLPAMKHGLIQPEHLIDVTHLSELSRLEETADHLIVGAAIHHNEVASSPMVAKAIPALAYLASQIGDPQVRVRGTLGGSIANNDPAADYPAGTLGLKAMIVTDQREIDAQDFFTGFYSTALEENELIQYVKFAKPLKSAYCKLKQAASGYAVVGIFIAVYPNHEVRVAVTGVAAGVFRWTQAEEAFQSEHDQPVLERDDLINDLHASSAYRVNMAKVLFRRAVQQIKNS